MEFRGQEEPVDEMGVPYGRTPPSSAAAARYGAGGTGASEVRYQECLRNHAAALGGHVVDGCGEFMPGAGDADALKCAACGCHRSFHRKDDGQLRLLLPAPTARVPLLMPPLHPYAAAGHTHLSSFPYHHNPSGSGGTTTESSSEERGPPSPTQGQQARRKRFRTKFTPEQKEQMLVFAERVGWRMQKQDEALVEQFCAQVGVRRNVFKVWMHNNKSSSRRQPQEQQQQQQQ
ncbi:hypothetical protein GUJ93_ZPchr0070g33427 [Zizania palustris]|uniref:ZF-HD dimerization-type domain-containing protein n=1 Tax=Zizania palustris TaxID=103762 RepID=A0A8J5R362_ZIZPA|nr:hypothetical protein GUJ93_ZPchr0070g33427 [Zizania palustris]